LREIIHLRTALESFTTAIMEICCVIHIFLGRSHTNVNNALRLVNPVLDRNTFIFKVTVFI